MSTHVQSIAAFTAQFPDEEACRKHFETIRFRNGEYCPHCGHTTVYRYKDGKRFRCGGCKQDFTIKTGTIFGESKLPLRKWFMAIYLLTTCRKGISSVQLAEQVGVTQKTAWFMDHRLREAMKQGNGQLFGAVEVDECYIGGKAENMHARQRRERITGRGAVGKTPVIGLVQRAGETRAAAATDTTMRTLEQHVVSNVQLGSSLYTDEFSAYHRLGSFYGHERVNHKSGEYVRGAAHTNSVESFWALFKRGYVGIYHWMSEKHLQRYLDEFTYRVNAAEVDFSETFCDVLSRVSDSDWLSYKRLIA